MRSPEYSNQFVQARNKLHDPSITLIYNDNAGIYKKNPLRALKFRHTLHSLQHFLEGEELMGLHVDLRPTKSAAHAEDVVDQSIKDGRGAIGVIGGDGTVAPVAYRLALEDTADKPFLLPFGGGTQDIFQTEISSRKDPFQAAIDELINGEPVAVDLGVVQTASGTFPFGGNMDLGLGAHVMNAWEESGKGHRGQIFGHFLRERHLFKPYDLAIHDITQGTVSTYEDVAALPIVNAGPYGIFKITDSNMTDGVLEGVALPSSLKEGRNIPRLLTDALIPNRRMSGGEYFAVEHAAIRENNGEELIFQHDGEPQRAGSSEVIVYTLPRSVTVLTANSQSPTFNRAA